MSLVHPAAERGYTAEAQAYARGRPGYPAELLPWLESALGLEAGRVAVDLGAGTGKFTRLLARTGADLTAVEPVEPMRARLAADLPQVRALAGTAEALPLQAGEADAVVCAQAFHWFATEAALAEMHRVLKPGGRLGLVWNVRDESVDWVAAMTEIITPYEGDAPRFYKGDWRRPFETGRWFDAPVLTRFVHAHVGSVQEVLIDRSLSVSFIAALPADEKARVEARLRALAAEHPALRGRTTLSFPYVTEAYVCMRKDAAS